MCSCRGRDTTSFFKQVAFDRQRFSSTRIRIQKAKPSNTENPKIPPIKDAAVTMEISRMGMIQCHVAFWNCSIIFFIEKIRHQSATNTRAKNGGKVIE